MDDAGLFLGFDNGVRCILPGALVVLSTGKHGDYAIQSLFKVLKPMRERETLAAFQEAYPDQIGDAWYGQDFATWLEREGYVIRESYLEWHWDNDHDDVTATIGVVNPRDTLNDAWDAQHRAPWRRMA